MSTMSFDATGIMGARKASPVKQSLIQHPAPRPNPVRELPPAPAEASRARTFFGFGSALSYECDSWTRWTGV
ncbi:hypothetical protein [Massilia niastensis]|uniref:hypothetical protein n=1 Tax=Massilia niastensis TaxID=544911 RepID=UPI0003703E98|nr:hypothetical protein [Massilia niastensis]